MLPQPVCGTFRTVEKHNFPCAMPSTTAMPLAKIKSNQRGFFFKPARCLFMFSNCLIKISTQINTPHIREAELQKGNQKATYTRPQLAEAEGITTKQVLQNRTHLTKISYPWPVGKRELVWMLQLQTSSIPCPGITPLFLISTTSIW